MNIEIVWKSVGRMLEEVLFQNLMILLTVVLG